MNAPPCSPPPSDSPPPPDRDRAVLELTVELREFVVGLANMLAMRERRERTWTTIKRTGGLFAVVAIVFTWATLYGPMLGWSRAPAGDVVAVISISGTIGAQPSGSARQLVPLIERACRSKTTKALVLNINSPGGAPGDASRIAEALQVCKEDERSTPVYAVIEGTGASAAYLIAAGADEIYVGRYALVGSLGAVMRNFDAGDLAERFGVRERVYASGTLKAGNSVWSSNSAEQDALNQELVDGIARAFTEQVTELRGDRLKLDTPDLFSGRVWTAADALNIGLADGISSLEQLRRSKLGDAPLHEYPVGKSFNDRLGLTSLVHTFAASLGASLRQTAME